MRTTLVGNTHLVAGRADRIKDVLSVLESNGVKIHANPDMYVHSYSHFGIDEARELRERASMRAIGERRIFIIAVGSITSEAQNALLKTLEEPAADAMFFLIVPSPETLLPTLRSRAQTLSLNAGERAGRLDAEKFLSASPQERLDLLKPLLSKDDDEKRDIGAIIGFLSSVEQLLAKNTKTPSAREGIRTLYQTRKFITDKGALVKPLLEQVALLVPRS